MVAEWRLRHHPVLGQVSDQQTAPFTFEGRQLEGLEGEPIAVALLANGLRTLRHAEGSGEPRGLYCGIGQCYECRVTVDGTRNVRACVTPLRAGMRIERDPAIGGNHHDA